MKALVIYHANCSDGMTSAWIAEGVLSQSMDCKIYPASYGEEPPYDLLDNKTIVYIVDFSYPPEVLKEVCDLVHQVVVLDHHKSAIEKLSGFEHPFCTLHFALDKSGAGLTWEWFFPNKSLPPFVQYVQARDLWLKDSLEDVDLVSAAISSFEFSLEAWDELSRISIEDLKQAGYWIWKKQEKEIKGIVASSCRPLLLGDTFAMACNVPGYLASDTGHAILRAYPNTPFAITYYDMDGMRKFSLRSEEGRADVSKIAQAFGGGGHRNAAGFSVSFKDLNSEGWLYYPVKLPDIIFDEEEIKEEEEQEKLAKDYEEGEQE